MAIYPERNRRTGDYTGTWIVEITSDGKRKRERAYSIEEARRVEATLKGEYVPPDDSPRETADPSRFTLRDLDRAVRFVLWRDQKNEQLSIMRWRVVVELIGPDTPIREIRKPTLDRLVESLRKRKARGKGGGFCTPKTVNRYLSAISKALRWAFESDRIPAMPPIPWQEEGPGKEAWLRESDQPALLAHICERYGPDYAFLTEVLIVTGMRVAELLNLKPDQVEGDSIRLLASQTKTGKPRVIPLPEGFGSRLVEVIWAGVPLYRDLLDAIRDSSVALELPEQLTPHALRHTAATRLKSAGVNVLTIMDLLGHTSVSTTAGYSHGDEKALRGAVNTLHNGGKGDGAERGKSPHKGMGRRLSH